MLKDGSVSDRRYRPRYSASMPKMGRVPLDDGECPVNLFQQNYARYLVRVGHLSQREKHVCTTECRLAEPACRPHRTQQRQGTADLLLFYKLRKCLRVKFASL